MRDQKPNLQQRLGGTLEQFSHDVFDAFRWMTFIALTRYIAIKAESDMALMVSYGLAGMLMIFLFAVFMLRGNIVVFRKQSSFANFANIAINVMICLSIFASSLWLTYTVVDIFVDAQQI